MRFMLPLIEQHREQIEALCRKYRIKRLELFGSAARGEFNAEKSDVDFLVLFDASRGDSPNQSLFELHAELEQLLARKVDLVDISAARNPYFVADALRHRVRLYAA
jgi:uncharacterized protein